MKNWKLQTEYSPDCCTINYSFGLPCRHFLLKHMEERQDQAPYISINDFDPRWLHNYSE